MKMRLFTLLSLLIVLNPCATWVSLSQAADFAQPSENSSFVLSSHENSQLVPEDSLNDDQTILIWTKQVPQLVSEYDSWEVWLQDTCASPDSLHGELLASVRAIATIIPGLEVSTDETTLSVIIVSGHPVALGALLDRLRDHPLLARVTEDSPTRREEARTIWVSAESIGDCAVSRRSPALSVNVRNNWARNTVWGYGAPGTTVHVTLTRSGSLVLTAMAEIDAKGRYQADLPMEILDGDVIGVNDGTTVKAVTVIPIKVAIDPAAALITSTLLPVLGMTGLSPSSLEVVVGPRYGEAMPHGGGVFAADFRDAPFHRGTPGFLLYTDESGDRIFSPFSTPIVQVRRDVSSGLPYGSVHMDGISSIVWGSATPDAVLAVTLTRPGDFVVTRTVTAGSGGNFEVSVDRLIEDGDIVQVWDGPDLETVPVPTITIHVDLGRRIITGTAPAGITTTLPGAPHSLEIYIAGNSRQITTTSSGEFSADFSASPYLAALLGRICYTTPNGDRVYKSLFVGDPLLRGQPGDWRADVILGQPDFSQITPNEVVSNKLFNPAGVYVDRSAQPNRVYVYDAGNSRVLGLSHLGTCLAGSRAGQDCTGPSDCPGSSCQIQEEISATVVLGQPSFSSSACNGDSGYQMYPDVPMASAETLCGLREEQLSILEGGSCATMATDDQGNLYVPDFFNNRVLRYDDPFTTDSTADYVWGQADFSGITCNRGAGAYSHSDSQSLCLALVPGFGELAAGVAIDSAGNLWVSDNGNNRVLRFPFDPGLGVPAPNADLVLGQPDFTGTASGSGLSQMNRPASVRVDDQGNVYVADYSNHRVLVFAPPLANGMPASQVLGDGQLTPRGLEFDPAGGLWVNDDRDHEFILFVDGVTQTTVPAGDSRAWGGLGVDRDGNLMAVGWDWQEGLHYSPPTYLLDSRFLRSEQDGIFNRTGSRGVYGGIGLEVTSSQLIYGDGSRMLFWNNPWNLTDYQPADGVVGEPDFHTRHRWGPWFERMRADNQGRLWVIHGTLWQVSVYGYNLPLQTGETPAFNLTSPLPLQGGGVFTWTWTLLNSGIAFQPSCDCLWLSDEESHRVFRIRDISTWPVVDIVLGQLNASGTQCNQGRGRDVPSQDSLCHPGALAFDKAGNLYVADHNLEFDGNLRLLEFDADTLPDAPASAVFGILATHVFGRNGSFTQPYCLSAEEDPMCAPWEPAFDSEGRMVIGFNAYFGPRFPMVYEDPLASPLPTAALGDFHSQPLSARFDLFDNLYVVDSNRARILIYRNLYQAYEVTGAIRTIDGHPVPGVQVETVGGGFNGISDASGAYTLTGLITGTYVLVPSKVNYTFTPVTRTVSVPPDMGGQDFVAAQEEYTIYLPVVLRQ